MLKTEAEALCLKTIGKQFLDDIKADVEDDSYVESAGRILHTYGADFKGAVDIYSSAFFLKNYGSIPDDAVKAILGNITPVNLNDKPDVEISPPPNSGM